MTSKTARGARQRRAAQARPPRDRRGDRHSRLWMVLAALAVTAIVLGLGYALSGGPGAGGGAGSGSYAIGQPGPGQQAPDFTLAASTGERIGLSDYRGQTVLLYFQEGLMCQPCWDQMRDIERTDALRQAGIDAMLSVTTDPNDLVTRKVTDDGITTPTLSDPDLAVSEAYSTNMYGMMGQSRNGHSFILVGPDGVIQWRADYGGEPNYTMYVPVDDLFADLDAGRRA